MSEGSSSGKRGIDSAWRHGKPLDNNKFGSVCVYCGQVMKSGGVSRLKEHLAGGYKNVKDCPNVPKEVRQEMKDALKSGLVKRIKKKDTERETFEHLRYGHNEPPSDDDDDDDDIVYPPDVVTNEEKREYKRAIHASKEARWKEEQEKRFRGPGGTSGSGSGSAATLRRSQSTRHTPSIDPYAVRTEIGKQKNLKDMMKGGTAREKIGKFISKWFIYNHVPANAARSPHFAPMIDAIAESGRGVQPPTPEDILGKYLDQEVAEIEAWIKNKKESWRQYGITIMCDGWTGPTKLSILNFMIYSRGSAVFLKSVDVSGEMKDANYLYKMMAAVIEEVGPELVVQFVTDNASAFIKAGKALMKKYNIYWTPCAAHSIDLILEDIGKGDQVSRTIGDARMITNFIYNHSIVLAKMRAKLKGELVRPGATRFATHFLALQSIGKFKTPLKGLFTEDWWSDSPLSKTEMGEAVENVVLNNAFWNRISNLVTTLEPIYEILRAVDNEKWPMMGGMYEGMRIMKEKIKVAMPRSYRHIHDIIDNRWERTLSHPLHAAGKFIF